MKALQAGDGLRLTTDLLAPTEVGAVQLSHCFTLF
jgi:hypothetical protein